MTDGPPPTIPLGPGAEFDLVRRLVARWGPLAEGIGDDAAVVDLPAGERLVVSTDASVDRVHFRRDWLSAREIGYRATASALSDLAAMGARAVGVVVALTLPDAWRDALDDLADGIGDAVRRADGRVLGGDLSRGGELALAVTVLGAASRPVGRASARPGDALYVTGALGGPLRTLRALERGEAPSPADRARFAAPVARVAEGQWLAARGASAMIDVSDGLAADLRHVAAASGVRLCIDGDRVPCVAGASLEDALASGEEYELALTASPALDVLSFASTFGVPLTRIGTVEASRGEAGSVEVRGVESAARVDLPPGHDHFSR